MFLKEKTNRALASGFVLLPVKKEVISDDEPLDHPDVSDVTLHLFFAFGLAHKESLRHWVHD